MSGGLWFMVYGLWFIRRGICRGSIVSVPRKRLPRVAVGAAAPAASPRRPVQQIPTAAKAATGEPEGSVHPSGAIGRVSSVAHGPDRNQRHTPTHPGLRKASDPATPVRWMCHACHRRRIDRLEAYPTGLTPTPLALPLHRAGTAVGPVDRSASLVGHQGRGGDTACGRYLYR